MVDKQQFVDKKVHLPFVYFSIAVLIALPFHILIQDGMFMDAVHYTCVSRNLSEGFGSFWFPHFSKLDLAIEGVHAFHEQPPLVFGLQALLFKLLGDSIYVERIYVALCVLFTAYIIKNIWKCITIPNQSISHFFWLPILLWISTPIVFWAGSNNVHENTLGLFALLSVGISYKLAQEKSTSAWPWLLSGSLIFLATFSKGFPGLFPLGAPFLFWLSHRGMSFKKMIIQTLLLLAAVVGLIGILLLFETPRESLATYFFKRVVYRVTEATTSKHRWETLQFLLADLGPMLAILLLSYAWAKVKKINTAIAPYKSAILFFFLVGLSASLPLMLTMIQKPFYVVPAYPYFAIAASLLLLPVLRPLFSKIRISNKYFKVWRSIAIVLLIAAPIVVALHYGKTSRDAVTIADIHAIGQEVGKGGDISVSAETFFGDWVLQCYIMRYHKISLDYRPEITYTYYLSPISESHKVDTSLYQPINIPLEKYRLYKLPSLASQ